MGLQQASSAAAVSGAIHGAAARVRRRPPTRHHVHGDPVTAPSPPLARRVVDTGSTTLTTTTSQQRATRQACHAAAPLTQERGYNFRFKTRTAAFLAMAALVVAVGGPAAAAQRSRVAVKAAPAASAAATQPPSSAPVRLAVVAPLEEMSQFGVPWREVLEHTAERLGWTDASFHLSVYDAAAALEGSESAAALQQALAASDVALAIGVQQPATAAALAPMLQSASTAMALASSSALQAINRVAGRDVGTPSAASGISGVLLKAQAFFGSAAAVQRQSDLAALDTIRELFQRYSSDDLLYCFLVLVNQAVRSVPAVANSTTGTQGGPDTLNCMISKCKQEIFGCLVDSSCRTALGCLNSCKFNDQVCSYRCIASYESPKLEAFSLCVLQKNNCLGLTAEIPTVPNPAPMTFFRGAPLTHALAEDLLIGWLKEPTSSVERPQDKLEPVSWRVFAGKNPAYDYFPFQNQLFYRGKAKGSMWYQPVFKVITLGGQQVWRQRLYRVRRGPEPGTFRLSVLDNGVTSKENWTLLDFSDDLEFSVFYYSGAASAAGLSYTGAILASRTGAWPEGEAARERIHKALARAGIKPWELSNVSWEGDGSGAPLQPANVGLVAA